MGRWEGEGGEGDNLEGDQICILGCGTYRSLDLCCDRDLSDGKKERKRGNMAKRWLQRFEGSESRDCESV